MQPRIFIGSSIESITIAQAIKSNIESEAVVSIWNESIFQLSNTGIESLIESINNFDFALFVFKPDDVSIIRDKQYQTVRDNVIFELGLFIGKLGRSRVFFAVPQSVENLHLPTDLSGITYGTFAFCQNEESLKQNLEPFCSTIKSELRKFVYENLEGLKDEPDSVKTIAYEKPFFWRLLLLAEILEPKLEEVKRSLLEIETGKIYFKARYIEQENVLSWYVEKSNYFRSLIEVFTKVVFEEINRLGTTNGNEIHVLDVKRIADKIMYVCDGLVSWDYSIRDTFLPSEIEKLKSKMTPWIIPLINAVYVIPSELRRIVKGLQDGIPEDKLKIDTRIDLGSLIPETTDFIMTFYRDRFN